MTFTHYRHATSLIEWEGKKILIDPLFAPKGTYPPIQNTKNQLNNPLIDLTVDYQDLLDADGVIITHNHNDHFDELAKEVMPKNKPLLCQIEDEPTFRALGFTQVTAPKGWSNWLGFACQSHPGYHGGHFYRKRLGPSSAFFLQGKTTSLYITGDTLLTAKVKKKLRSLKPEKIIAFGGNARMNKLGKLTMNHRDILKLARLMKKATVVAVHMDSLNHCRDNKKDLKSQTPRGAKIYVPEEGEKILLG
jgi:L-ascorbate metabolism protein UlaG (beta-lactamase superfamily)